MYIHYTANLALIAFNGTWRYCWTISLISSISWKRGNSCWKLIKVGLVIAETACSWLDSRYLELVRPTCYNWRKKVVFFFIYSRSHLIPFVDLILVIGTRSLWVANEGRWINAASVIIKPPSVTLCLQYLWCNYWDIIKKKPGQNIKLIWYLSVDGSGSHVSFNLKQTPCFIMLMTERQLFFRNGWA